MDLIPLDSKMDESIVPWIGKTMKLIDILVATMFQDKEMDLTKNQVIVMRLISNGMHAQSDLSIVTERDKSSLSRLLKSMMNKGLVRREKDKKDARQFLIYLTEKGQTVLNEALPVLGEAFLKISNGIPTEEREIVKSVMERLQVNIHEELTLLDNK